jgi:C1A family cysteine protease
METQFKYSWLPDLPDHNDYYYEPSLWKRLTTSSSVDLRPGMPEVWNQGQLGSCVSHGVLACDEFAQKKEKLTEVFKGSRLFCYYVGRSIEKTVSVDSGLQVRDGVKAVATKGICPEHLWPYDISKFAEKPPQAAFEEAIKHPAVKYYRVEQNRSHIMACLDEGYPIVFGFTVYEELEGDEILKTGILPMPTSSSKNLGGHCTVICGYDKASKLYLIRNSWGKHWPNDQLAGYFYIPFSYVENSDLASDFWTLRVVK